MERLRLHVVSLPHTQTTRAFSTCAYTQKVRKFCRMMHERGHAVTLYAGEENDAPCDEHVACVTEAERAAGLGNRHYVHFPFDMREPLWDTFNRRARAAIARRAQRGDILCLIGGLMQQPIAAVLPHLVTVEFGIGYVGTFARYRVFESYAWMHAVYAGHRNPYDVDGVWQDAVIPNYFEVEDFPFNAVPDDYYLFVGRLTARKGYHVAAEVCRREGLALKIAGVGAPPAYGEYVGEVGPEARGALMGGAKALFVPTQYIEPFGGVAVEAMLCGTPVIATDWGAFPETVQEGITGYRCRSLDEFAAAAHAAPGLDRRAVREHARARYSLEAVAPLYERYFARILAEQHQGARAAA